MSHSSRSHFETRVPSLHKSAGQGQIRGRRDVCVPRGSRARRALDRPGGAPNSFKNPLLDVGVSPVTKGVPGQGDLARHSSG
jgi:hypothetical protein